MPGRRGQVWVDQVMLGLEHRVELVEEPEQGFGGGGVVPLGEDSSVGRGKGDALLTRYVNGSTRLCILDGLGEGDGKFDNSQVAEVQEAKPTKGGGCMGNGIS